MRRNSIQSWVRNHTGLPPEASVLETVRKLIKQGQAAGYAAEMIFGMRRDTSGNVLNSDPIAWHLFIKLWSGRYPHLLLMLAEHHKWSDARATSGYSMEVFPGEWLVVEEPYSDQLLTSL